MSQAVTYKPVERVSSVEAVETKLRNDILSGRLKPGDKLPPERELALALGVNRLTLRTGLSRLIASNLLVSQQGDGNRVLDFRLHSGFERLPELAEAVIDNPHAVAKSVADLLELRRSVLIEAVAVAVTRAETEHIERLRFLVAEQARNTSSWPAFMEGDFAISRLVLEIADNLAFTLVFNTVIRFAREHADLLRCMFADTAINLRGYEGLVALIEGGDPDDARLIVRQAMEFQDAEHLKSIRAYLKLASEAEPSREPFVRRKPTC